MTMPPIGTSSYESCCRPCDLTELTGWLRTRTSMASPASEPPSISWLMRCGRIGRHSDRSRGESRHSGTIFLQIVYSLERGRVGVSVRALISRCKIRKNWRATADEDGHYSLAIPL